MRRPRQDELGPFWANRGKRDPGYTKEVLYAEEPHWITLRNSLFDEATTDSSPFYVTRGKKDRRKMSQGKWVGTVRNKIVDNHECRC